MPRSLALLFAGFACCGLLSSAPAAEIPWSSPGYLYQAKDEKLADLFKNFCALQGVNVVVSPLVQGRVSGKFDKIPPQLFLAQMCKANNLVWYWDGKKLYIYSNNELKNGVIPMSPGLTQQLTQVLDKMGTSHEWTTLKPIEEQGLTVLSGPPRFFELITDLSKQLEHHQSEVTVQVFPLKHAWAYDLQFDFRDEEMSVPGVATVLQAVVNDGQTGALFQSGGRAVYSSTAEKLKNKGMIQQSTPAHSASIPQPSPSTAPAPVGVPGESASFTPGQPNIFPDVRLNAVVIRDTRENLSRFGELIKELDVPVAIIEIKAAIVDINADATRVLGTDFLVRVKDGKSFVQFGNNGGIDTTDSNVNSSTSNSGFLSQGGPVDVVQNLFPVTGGSITGLIVNSSVDFLTRIKLMEDKGDAKLLSQPSVLTSDNVQATLKNDQTYYVRVAGYQDVNLFNVTAGVTLQVTPHVVDDGGARKIKLVLNIKDGNFTDVTVDQLPTVRESSISTQATLLENQSLLVGGYTQEYNETKSKGVPWLGDIPIVGYLFKREQKDKRKWERLFLISPRVVTLQYDENADVQKYFPPSKPASATNPPLVQPAVTPDIQDTAPLPAAEKKSKPSNSSKGFRP